MTKRAFTLSEAIIVLGIVAIITGLSVTAVVNAKPDEDIIMFRKAHRTTQTIVAHLLADSVLYPNVSLIGSDSDTGPLANYKISNLGKGLGDTAIPTEIANLNYFTGLSKTNKFTLAFIDKINPIESSTNSTGGTFTTADGIYWEIKDYFNSYPAGTASISKYHNIAFVDVYLNGSDKTLSCNMRQCTYPSAFRFLVHKNGSIEVTSNVLASSSYAKDSMACSYLKYPRIIHKRQIPTNNSVNPCF